MSQLYNYDVFISHSSDDEKSAHRLADKLHEFGFLCSWGMKINKLLSEPLVDVMENSAVCLLLLGAGGSYPWFNDDVRDAIQSRIKRTRGTFRVIPVLMPGATEGRQGEMISLRRAIEQFRQFEIKFIRFIYSLDEQEAIQQLILNIRGAASVRKSIWDNAFFRERVRRRAQNALNIDWGELISPSDMPIDNLMSDALNLDLPLRGQTAFMKQWIAPESIFNDVSDYVSEVNNQKAQQEEWFQSGSFSKQTSVRDTYSIYHYQACDDVDQTGPGRSEPSEAGLGKGSSEQPDEQVTEKAYTSANLIARLRPSRAEETYTYFFLSLVRDSGNTCVSEPYTYDLSYSRNEQSGGSTNEKDSFQVIYRIDIVSDVDNEQHSIAGRLWVPIIDNDEQPCRGCNYAHHIIEQREKQCFLIHPPKVSDNHAVSETPCLYMISAGFDDLRMWSALKDEDTSFEKCGQLERAPVALFISSCRSTIGSWKDHISRLAYTELEDGIESQDEEDQKGQVRLVSTDPAYAPRLFVVYRGDCEAITGAKGTGIIANKWILRSNQNHFVPQMGVAINRFGWEQQGQRGRYVSLRNTHISEHSRGNLSLVLHSQFGNEDERGCAGYSTSDSVSSKAASQGNGQSGAAEHR